MHHICNNTVTAVSRSRIPRVVAFTRVQRQVRPRTLPCIARASLVESSAVIGHGIMFFTFFYCSFNWFHYRELRKQMKNDDDKLE